MSLADYSHLEFLELFEFMGAEYITAFTFFQSSGGPVRDLVLIFYGMMLVLAVLNHPFLRVPGSNLRIEDNKWVCLIEGRGMVATGRRL
jgi:hypothetical protein